MAFPAEEVSERIIRGCAAGVFGRETIFKFQMDGIRSLVFPQNQHSSSRTCVFVGARTGSGKSLIMNCAAAILQGITVHVAPTIPLGVDQSSNFNQNVSSRRDQGISIRSIHLETMSCGARRDLALESATTRRLIRIAPQATGVETRAVL